MTAAELMAELADAGVVVRIAPDDPGALDVDGPDAALTAERLAVLRSRKPELLVLLTGRDDAERAACEQPPAVADDAYRRLLAGQLAQLVRHVGDDGKVSWINPRFRRQLEMLGEL